MHLASDSLYQEMKSSGIKKILSTIWGFLVRKASSYTYLVVLIWKVGLALAVQDLSLLTYKERRLPSFCLVILLQNELIKFCDSKFSASRRQCKKRSIRVCETNNDRLVNSDTLAALQILQPESHPNAAKQGPGTSDSKESLSIYGLFLHFARTPQGKERLRSMFVRPSTDRDVIKERHDAVAVFSLTENRDALQKLSKSLAKIKNMDRIMTALRKGIEGGNTTNRSIKSGIWSSLLDFCFHVIEISETLQEMNGIQLVPLYRRLSRAFVRTEFQRIGKTVWDVVDRDESQQQSRTVVKRGINQDLDQVKDAYDSMDELLSRTAIETVSEFPPDVPVSTLSVVYIPQLGFHITMAHEAAEVLTTQGLNGVWEKVFTTDAGAYFKNNRMRTLDNELGDLWAQICDAEIEISHELAQRVIQKENFLVEASNLCGQLDALLALAHGVAEYELVRPIISDENVIDIKSGRHLIQENIVPSFVANDAKLRGGCAVRDSVSDSTSSEDSNIPTLLLITGPNYSGKSVYLKQVALIGYLAQVGSFVPARQASLGIIDRVMTRVTTRETVSKGQSSFMIDLQQMSHALNALTPRSLLVIDEFGKGTDNCDGAGLFAGVLSYLLSLGEQSPKALVSTHFHEIFEQGILSEDTPGLGLKQMEIHIRPLSRARRHVDHDDRGEVTYLYNVRDGRSKLSYGAQCAAMNGIPNAIVERASELTDMAIAGEDLVASCSSVAPEEIADLEEAESLSRSFLDMDLSAIENRDTANFRVLMEQMVTGSSAAHGVVRNGSRPQISSTIE